MLLGGKGGREGAGGPGRHSSPPLSIIKHVRHLTVEGGVGHDVLCVCDWISASGFTYQPGAHAHPSSCRSLKSKTFFLTRLCVVSPGPWRPFKCTLGAFEEAVLRKCWHCANGVISLRSAFFRAMSCCCMTTFQQDAGCTVVQLRALLET